MPLSAQSLYFQLGVQADDDGFVGNPKKIQRMLGASDDDAKLLVAKNFLIPFHSGVIVITHWRLHNYIQKDRYKPTIWQEEARQIRVTKTKEYSLDTKCIQNVSNLDTQVRLGKS